MNFLANSAGKAHGKPLGLHPDKGRQGKSSVTEDSLSEEFMIFLQYDYPASRLLQTHPRIRTDQVLSPLVLLVPSFVA